MFTITNGFTYFAFLMLVAGGLAVLPKYTKWKLFEYVPPLVLIYVVNMIFCTIGMFDMTAGSPVKNAYSNTMYNILYAMIFVLLLQCDFRKLIKLGGRMFAIFLAGTLTIGIGFVVGYPIFMNLIGGGEVSWAAASALYGSWVAGTGAMISVGAALGANEGAFACALAVDTVVYTAWVAFALFLVRYNDKWNKKFKADTSKLDDIAKIANEQVEAAQNAKVTGGDWMFLIGISLVVSAISQWAGGVIDGMFVSVGITALGKTTCTALFVTIVGLICAMTPLGKHPAISGLSTVYMYAVVSLMASTASLTDLISAPMWLVYGLFILAVHAVLMIVLSKIFKWDLAMVATASVGNVGGVVSTPVVAAAFNPSFAGIGVLMGVLGAALGNICGIGIGPILRMIAGC